MTDKKEKKNVGIKVPLAVVNIKLGGEEVKRSGSSAKLPKSKS